MSNLINNRLKLLVFGTGNYYQRYKGRFESCQVLALVDNQISKQGQFIDNRVIIAPCNIDQYKYDYIVILIEKYESVKEQLLLLGVNRDKIICPEADSLFEKFRIVKDCHGYEKGDVLLISHDMGLRGAPLMLYQMACVMKNKGIAVDVAATEYGALGECYKEQHINVFLFDDFRMSENEVRMYFDDYKLIVVNTLANFALVNELKNTQAEVIWWLHEEWSAYEIFHINRKKIDFWNRLHVCGVGNRAISAFYDFFGHATEVMNLQWGIEFRPAVRSVNKSKIIIAVIGPVCRIKGQDILIQAIKEDGNYLYSGIEIWIIGDISDLNRKEFEKFKCIRIMGSLNHEEVLKLYGQIDIVLSTSRNDTMPVVLVEGMMNKKVCVTSDGTGVSDYICQYKNGVVFKAESPSDLNEKLRWVLINKRLWSNMGENAYKLYQEKFSLDNFEKEIDDIFDLYLH